MSNGNVEKAILAEMGKPRSGLIDRVTRHNQILLHNYRKAVPRSCECQLMGCAQSFAITLVPNQVLYPKYCEAHRSEYRRGNFLRQFAGQPAVYRVGTFQVVAEPSLLPSLPE
ncbi:MAG TPA: hypothetical protein VJ385_13220 [Fibrobacteria bacterium]|nr:hypothetical protein [Fibrobacteria bacterium]